MIEWHKPDSTVFSGFNTIKVLDEKDLQTKILEYEI
jgi:hypothetical protein